MNENEQALHYTKKLNERLTIILTHNLPHGHSIIDSDREVIREVHRLYDEGRLEWLVKEPLETKPVIQGDLFTQNTDTLALTTTTEQFLPIKKEKQP